MGISGIKGNGGGNNILIEIAGARAFIVISASNRIRARLIFLPFGHSSAETEKLNTGISIVTSATHMSLANPEGRIYHLGYQIKEPGKENLLIAQLKELFGKQELLEPNSGLLYRERFEKSLCGLEKRGLLARPEDVVAVFLVVDSSSLFKPSTPEIQGLIESVNLLSDERGRNWGAIEESLNKLSALAAGKPYLIRAILEGIAAVPNKDRFVEALSNIDPQKPRFDPAVSPERFFPVKEISQVLADSGMSVEVRAEVSEYNAGKIDISLIAGTKTIAGLEIQPRNILGIFQRNPDLGDRRVKGIIWNETSGYYEQSHGDETNRIYYGLNWWADITYFELSHFLRERGIGEAWYEKYVEPYLRNCGFGIAAIHGQCLDSRDVTAFWHARGFKFEFALTLNQLYNSETVMNHMIFKRI